MRRDWDYVEFADYSRDMDELGRAAAQMTSAQASEIRELKHLIACLVAAAGGRIAVHDTDMHQLSAPRLVIERSDQHMQTIFRTSQPPSLSHEEE